MTMPDSPRDTALLQAENAALREMIQMLQAQIETLKQDNVVLRLKVDAMARKLFGKSSEKLDPAQLQMVFEALQKQPLEDDAAKKHDASSSSAEHSEAEREAAGAAKNAPRKKRTAEELMNGLPVVEIIIDPEEVKADPQAWSCIGAEVTKLIDYTPGKFHAQHLVRRKYVRKEERHLPPIIAPLLTLQERCIASPKLLAHTLTNRFELHLPYYRIEQMYERAGLPIARQTLCGWAGMAHDASRLVLEAIKREVFADGYVQADETPIKYQDPERQGVCGTGYLWVFHNPVRNISYMEWRTTRATASLESIVPRDFVGLIQSDGYAAYESFIKAPGRQGQIQLAGCLAHARRKFFEAKAEGADAQWVLAAMQQLYQIEARQREARAGPLEVRAVRQQQSEPLLKRIKERLDELEDNHKHRPRSLTGGAIAYARKQWDKLTVYVRDGRVQIDNNLVENAIRPSAIGKKNWLFMGGAETGARAATFYTLIANCHRVGLKAEAYLTELFERLPAASTKTVVELTPQAMAAKSRAAPQTSVAELVVRNHIAE